MSFKNTLIIFILLFSTKLLAWETDFALTFPGQKSEPSRGDQVFHYLFSPELMANQNAKMHQDYNNNITTVTLPPTNAS